MQINFVRLKQHIRVRCSVKKSTDLINNNFFEIVLSFKNNFYELIPNHVIT